MPGGPLRTENRRGIMKAPTKTACVLASRWMVAALKLIRKLLKKLWLRLRTDDRQTRALRRSGSRTPATKDVIGQPAGEQSRREFRTSRPVEKSARCSVSRARIGSEISLDPRR